MPNNDKIYDEYIKGDTKLLPAKRGSLTGGTSDHSELTNLGYDQSGHFGFSPKIHEHEISDVNELWNELVTKENVKNRVPLSANSTSTQYPNASSVWDAIKAALETVPEGGLKLPIVLEFESDLGSYTPGQNGDYFIIEDMNLTEPGRAGKAWWNSAVSTTQHVVFVQRFDGPDGETIIHTGTGEIQVSEEWANDLIWSIIGAHNFDAEAHKFSFEEITNSIRPKGEARRYEQGIDFGIDTFSQFMVDNIHGRWFEGSGLVIVLKGTPNTNVSLSIRDVDILTHPNGTRGNLTLLFEPVSGASFNIFLRNIRGHVILSGVLPSTGTRSSLQLNNVEYLSYTQMADISLDEFEIYESSYAWIQSPINVNMLGVYEGGECVLRDSARINNSIYVSGRLQISEMASLLGTFSTTVSHGGQISDQRVERPLETFARKEDAVTVDGWGKVPAALSSSMIIPVNSNKTLGAQFGVHHDAGTLQLVDSTSAVTITIPTNASVAFPVGTEIEIVRWNTGAVTIAAASGVTILSSVSDRAIKDRYGVVAIKQITADNWLLTGWL